MNLFRKSLEDRTRVIREEQFMSKPARVIPTLDSPALTFNNVGKWFYGTILYIDIRHSSQLLESHHYDNVAKLLSAFYNAIVRVANQDDGRIRSFNGDSLLVFYMGTEEETITKAICSAMKMSYAINEIINPLMKGLTNLDFGIGIDYGTMNVLKVGIDVRDDEKQEYRNLVWVGYPANYASRLTDVANKTVTERYKIKGQSAFSIRRTDNYYERIYSKEDLLSSLKVGYNGLTPKFFSSVSTIEPIEHIFPPILVSEVVYKGYVKEASDDDSIKNNWWHVQDYPIKDIAFPVYGADVIWDV